MTQNLYARPRAATAIAAVLALLSTPALAQETTTVEPVAADPLQDPATSPAPPSSTEPAPSAEAEDPAPAGESLISTEIETEPAAAEPVAATPPARSRTAARAVRTAPAASTSASRPDPVMQAQPSVPVTAAGSGATSPAAAAPPPVESVPPAESGSTIDGADAAMLGGGALALLALGGGAMALRRRRRHEQEDEPFDAEPAATATHAEQEPADEPAAMPAANPAAEPRFVHASHHMPAEAEAQPAFIAPALSAFAWGGTAKPAPEPSVQAADEHPAGETWTERAMRGPTPDNPSLSLKKRLKRAAFFDARERDAAAGRAPDVEQTAGLPEAALETPEHSSHHQREPEYA
jgi:resuscitation-promoting factor RpfA